MWSVQACIAPWLLIVNLEHFAVGRQEAVRDLALEKRAPGAVELGSCLTDATR
jgi:hypothetical protein